jgi:hypothetical protein
MHFFVNKYMLYIETPRPNTKRHSCTQMFALCGKGTRDLLRSRRVFPPLRQIGCLSLYLYNFVFYQNDLAMKNITEVTGSKPIAVHLRCERQEVILKSIMSRGERLFG